MHYESIARINAGIKKNKKVIITLGCSFVEGQGALDPKIWDTYYKIDMVTTACDWAFTEDQKREIMLEFPDIRLVEGQEKRLDFNFHESNNSFGNVLCEKYFNDEYTCINLGRRGNGNRATIKDLYYYPEIMWDDIEETIVIFCPSGPERYDFADDQYGYVNRHGRWVTFWPHLLEPQAPRKIISEGLKKCVSSQKADLYEQIANIQELMLWCKYKKAKLVVVPAFLRIYDRTRFIESINLNIFRDPHRDIIKEEAGTLEISEIEKIVDMWPWENMFYPDSYPSLVDLLMAQEKTLDWEKDFFYTYIGKGTPDKWITPCAHPSKKGHDLFASVLYKHLQENL